MSKTALMPEPPDNNPKTWKFKCRVCKKEPVPFSWASCKDCVMKRVGFLNG